MKPSIGHIIIEEIVKQGMFSVAHPDPNSDHVFVWNANAAEQLEALVFENMRKGSNDIEEKGS